MRNENKILNRKYATAVCAVFIMIMTVLPVFADNTDDFISKALSGKKILDEKKAEYSEVEKKYDSISDKINELKQQRGGNFLTEWFRMLRLRNGLNKGNEYAFEMSVLDSEIKDINEELFTYVSLITENINSEIEQCLEKGCSDIQSVYDKRTDWIMMARENEDIFNVDLVLEDIGGNPGKEAMQDIRAYLNKKSIQIAQRMYLLSEEKSVLAKLRKRGIRINTKEFEDIELRMSELKVKSEMLRKAKKGLGIKE